MDTKLDILILLYVAPLQKLVFALGVIFIREYTVLMANVLHTKCFITVQCNNFPDDNVSR